MRMILMSLVVLGAAACGPTPTNPPEPGEPSAGSGPQTAAEATAQDTCGAGAYRNLIGTPVSAVDVQPGARVIGPDTMVTQDFVPDRLNFIVDAQGMITSLECY